MPGPSHYLLLSVLLFGLGLTGVLVRRNALVVLMCIEMMLGASNLLLVAFGQQAGLPGGQAFAFFSMTVAAAEVAVGLAVVVLLYRWSGGTDIGEVRLFAGPREERP